MFWLKLLGYFAFALLSGIVGVAASNDDITFIFPWTSKKALKIRKDRNITRAMFSFYNDCPLPFSGCNMLDTIEKVLNPHYALSPHPYKENDRRIWYEFSKVYKCSALGIYPKAATAKLESYYYSGVPMEWWEKEHPEFIRYGMGPAEIPYKIKHPYRFKPESQRAKLIAKVQIGENDDGPAYVKYDVTLGENANYEEIAPPWKEIVASMDPEIKARVRHLVAPCSKMKFLEAYLCECKEPFEMVLSQNTHLSVNYHQFVGYKLKLTRIF